MKLISIRKKSKTFFLLIFVDFYLITSPIVRDQSLKFKEEGIRDILKDVLLPWYNALHLLVQSCDQFKIEKKLFIYL